MSDTLKVHEACLNKIHDRLSVFEKANLLARFDYLEQCINTHVYIAVEKIKQIQKEAEADWQEARQMKNDLKSIIVFIELLGKAAVEVKAFLPDNVNEKNKIRILEKQLDQKDKELEQIKKKIKGII